MRGVGGGDKRVVGRDAVRAVGRIRPKRIDAEDLAEWNLAILSNVVLVDDVQRTDVAGIAAVTDADVEHAVVWAARCRGGVERDLVHVVIDERLGKAEEFAPRGGVDPIGIGGVDRPFGEHVVVDRRARR